MLPEYSCWQFSPPARPCWTLAPQSHFPAGGLFLLIDFLPVFQLSFCSRLGVQLNNTSLAFLSCLLQSHSLTLKVLGPYSRPLTLQVDVPGVHGIPKGLELSSAKVYMAQRKKALWVSKPDGIFNHHVPHTPCSHACAHATQLPPAL